MSSRRHLGGIWDLWLKTFDFPLFFTVFALGDDHFACTMGATEAEKSMNSRTRVACREGGRCTLTAVLQIRKNPSCVNTGESKSQDLKTNV